MKTLGGKLRFTAFVLLLLLLTISFLYPSFCRAQTARVVPVCSTLPQSYAPGATRDITQDVNGNTCIAGTFSQTGGTISNATSGQATTATNQGSVSYNYGFNGTTWDQLQVDASKFLKVNCTVGCSGGTFNNNTDAVATSATNGQVAAWLYGFNGTTYDRLRADTTNGLWVNVKASVLPTGAAISANQPTAAAQGSTTSGQTGSLVECAVTTAAPTYTTAQTDPLSCDTAGNVRVNVSNSNPNGRAVSGSSSPVVPTPALTTFHLIAANTTNATSVKGSAATLFSCQFSGVGSTPAFVKIYNKATAPTVGTDTPVKTLIIPAASTAANGGGSNIQFGPGGFTLGTGFALAVTGVITDADTTAVAAATFAINCDYE